MIHCADHLLFCVCLGPQSDRLAAVGLHEDSGVRHPVWSASRLAERTGKAGSFPGSSAEQVSDENR